MSEIENGRLRLHGTEHSKCNHLTTLGFKGLIALTMRLVAVSSMMALWSAETPVFGRCSRCWRSLIVAVLTTWMTAGSGRSTDRSKSAADAQIVYVGRGFAGRLDCPYTADPPATLIVWLRDGHVIDPDSRIRVSKAGSLLIRAAEAGDEGQYACAVYSPSGSTESSPAVQLLVRGKQAFHFVSCRV